MPFNRAALHRGLFTLMELAVVLVVLATVSAIVTPRMSRGAASSPHLGEHLLIGQLRSLRSAIQTYANEHGGHYPDGDAAHITRQLTQYSDWSGDVSPTSTPRHHLGPYLREIPPLYVGANKGSATINLAEHPADSDAAWAYNPATGQISPNTRPQEQDTLGRPYASY